MLPHPTAAPDASFPNIVLVGCRAAGKSRAAGRLAAATGWTRVSTDERIEERHGPIPALVGRIGWDGFREVESEVLAEVAGRRLVVDCGGGIVERARNLPRLRALGTVYWVRAPLRIVEERLARPEQRRNRPPLAGADPAGEAAAILRRRAPLYREAAGVDVWSGGFGGSWRGEAADDLRRAHFGPPLAQTVAAPTVRAAAAGLRRAFRECGPDDLVELRLDHLRAPTPHAVADLMAAFSEGERERLVVTARRAAEGGIPIGGAPARIALLEAAARAGAGWIDVEFAADRDGLAARRIREAGQRVRILSSFHDVGGVPGDLEALPDRMAATGPDATKIAVRAAGREDTRRLLRLVRRAAEAGRPLIGVAMGRPGRALRVTAADAGAALATYAPPEGLPKAAPGQLPASTVRSRHRRWGRRLAAPVPVYGVIGHPVGHSLSPPMHEAAFARLGIEAAYLPFPVPPAELGAFLEAARLTGAAGFNVTIPHKEAILPHLDAVGAEAGRIGAVNTIARVDGALVGSNTDADAAVRAVGEALRLPGRRATVLGAGGAARAVVHGLTQRGMEVVVMARRDRRAAALASDFGVGTRPFAGLARAEGDVLVNATPVGMGPLVDASPAPEGAIRGHDVVFDLVPHPEETRLLAAAAALGKTVIPGIRMLVLQAAAAFGIWTGRQAPVGRMEEAARMAAGAR